MCLVQNGLRCVLFSDFRLCIDSSATHLGQSPLPHFCHRVQWRPEGGKKRGHKLVVHRNCKHVFCLSSTFRTHTLCVYFTQHWDKVKHVILSIPSPCVFCQPQCQHFPGSSWCPQTVDWHYHQGQRAGMQQRNAFCNTGHDAVIHHITTKNKA